MRKSRSALVYLLLLVFGVSLAVCAEDLPETAYDESEGRPYKDTPPLAITVPIVARILRRGQVPYTWT